MTFRRKNSATAVSIIILAIAALAIFIIFTELYGKTATQKIRKNFPGDANFNKTMQFSSQPHRNVAISTSSAAILPKADNVNTSPNSLNIHAKATNDAFTVAVPPEQPKMAYDDSHIVIRIIANSSAAPSFRYMHDAAATVKSASMPSRTTSTTRDVAKEMIISKITPAASITKNAPRLHILPPNVIRIKIFSDINIYSKSQKAEPIEIIGSNKTVVNLKSAASMMDTAAKPTTGILSVSAAKKITRTKPKSVSTPIDSEITTKLQHDKNTATQVISQNLIADRINNNFNNNWAAMPSAASLALSSQDFGMKGPLTVSTQYSEIGGIGLHGQIADAVSLYNAFALAVDLAEHETRISGTIGHAFSDKQRIKFTGEYLAQDLDFTFESGPIKKWVGQIAYGLSYEYLLTKSIIKDINFNAFYSNAFNKELSSLPLEIGDLSYMNDRRIAGGTDRGISIGTDFLPFKNSLLGLKLNYDKLTYDKKYEHDKNKDDAAGLNFSVDFEQLLNKFLKFKASFEGYEPYKLYQVGINWLLPSKKGDSTELALTGEHIIGRGSLPNDNRISLSLNYRFGADPLASPATYSFSGENAFGADLANWTATPAVHMSGVLAVKDERLRLIEDKKLFIDSVSPTSCYSADYCMAAITIEGGGLIPTATNGISGNLTTAQKPAADIAVTAVQPPIVLFGSVPSSTVKVLDQQHIEAAVPPGVPGWVDVKVQIGSKLATLPSGFNYLNPEANYLNVHGRLLEGDRMVVLSGKGLDADDRVIFDDKQIGGDDILNQSENRITFITHKRAAGTAKIYTVDKFTKTDPINFEYSALSIEPKGGSAGTLVTLHGAGFDKNKTTVKFGEQSISKDALKFNDDGTTISFSVPDKAKAAVNNASSIEVVVTNPFNADNKDPALERSGDYGSAQFEYIDHDTPYIEKIDPQARLTDGAEEIHIFGSNFNKNDTVVIKDGKTITPHDITDHEMVFTSEPSLDHKTQILSLHVHDGETGKNSGEVTLTYYGLTIDPKQGKSGQIVTIAADNKDARVFDKNVAVTFNDTSAPVSIYTPNSLKVSVPDLKVSGNVKVTVTNPKGDFALQNFAYEPSAPYIIDVQSAVSLTNGGKKVHIHGVGFSKDDTIQFSDQPGQDIKIDSGATSSDISFSAPRHSAGLIAFVVHDSVSGLKSNSVNFNYFDLKLDKTTGYSGDIITITADSKNSQNVRIFDENASVLFDKSDGKPKVDSQGQSITVTAPDHAAGDIDVVVANTNSGDIGMKHFTYIQGGKPKITAVERNGKSPALVLSGGGVIPAADNLYIIGKNFYKDRVMEVLINNKPAEYKWISDEQLQITSVPGYLGSLPATKSHPILIPAKVKVKTKDGEDTADRAISYVFLAYDFINKKFSNPAAHIAGNDAVEIMATENFNFSKDAKVVFDNALAADIKLTSPSVLHLITPAHAWGEATIHIYNGGGNSKEATIEHEDIKGFPYYRVYITCPKAPESGAEICPNWQPTMVEENGGAQPTIKHETKGRCKEAGHHYRTFVEMAYYYPPGKSNDDRDDKAACIYQEWENTELVTVNAITPKGNISDIMMEDDKGQQVSQICRNSNPATCRLSYTRRP